MTHPANLPTHTIESVNEHDGIVRVRNLEGQPVRTVIAYDVTLDVAIPPERILEQAKP